MEEVHFSRTKLN